MNLSWAEAAELKIAVIDLSKVFKEYYKTEEAETRLKEQMTNFQKDRDERMEDYKKLVDQLKSLQQGIQDPAIGEQARKEKENTLKGKKDEARTRERELREFELTTQKLYRDQSLRMRSTIVEEIQKVITSVSKGKFNLVLDKSGSSTNGVALCIYAEGVNEITGQVIKELNKTKPAK